jgi:hypothetical protein
MARLALARRFPPVLSPTERTRASFESSVRCRLPHPALCFFHIPRYVVACLALAGSELVQKYVGEGARMVRELFEMARSKKACIIFFDEVDAIGGTRFDDGAGGDNEVQRTMLEIVNQLDGFDSRGNIKVQRRSVWC